MAGHGSAGSVEAVTYPVRIEGRLEEPLSRWLWLVKWLLLVPHLVVLVFLWIAYAASMIAVFFVLLFTGRYPHRLFEFNVGVLRWTWRVAFYSYSALGTDRYPPFTLRDVEEYPARLAVDYPRHQRRGLPLVGWWLLGIPQYVIAGLLGGGATLGFAVGGTHLYGGVTAILMLVAGVLLLVGRGYPRGIFDLAMGLDRWTVRVTVYASLMTPDYPPFRLDTGGTAPMTGAGPAVMVD